MVPDDKWGHVTCRDAVRDLQVRLGLIFKYAAAILTFMKKLAIIIEKLF